MRALQHKKLLSRLVKKSQRTTNLSLREFSDKRNSILIYRANGGLGDILVHRMIFEDFKRIMPDAKIVFACPGIYHQAIKGHPFVDELVDSGKIDQGDYLTSYNTTNACCRYEVRMAPLSGKNRSDIWANHCGVALENHNMHFQFSEQELIEAKREIESHRTQSGPTVLFSPISAMATKNLISHQMEGVVNGLRERGCYVFYTHTGPIPMLEHLKVPLLMGSIRKWMSFVASADYIVSVDTATFHMAGGLGKPQVGIFTMVDGKVYGRWYENWTLVQKHRDDGNWNCGPCYNWPDCPKSKAYPKPCLTELTADMILLGVDKMLKQPLKIIGG